jgi:hypothetical protein
VSFAQILESVPMPCTQRFASSIGKHVTCDKISTNVSNVFKVQPRQRKLSNQRNEMLSVQYIQYLPWFQFLRHELSTLDLRRRSMMHLEHAMRQRQLHRSTTFRVKLKVSASSSIAKTSGAKKFNRLTFPPKLLANGVLRQVHAFLYSSGGRSAVPWPAILDLVVFVQDEHIKARCCDFQSLQGGLWPFRSRDNNIARPTSATARICIGRTKAQELE